MTKHNRIVFLATLLLCLSLLSAFVGCSQSEQETVTIYPCYFNRDIEGVDSSVIRAALEQAGWELHSTEQNTEEQYTVYRYKWNDPSGGPAKVLSINAHIDADSARRHYEEMWSSNSLVAGFASSNQFFEMYLRISDCSIMALGNAHVDLLELLDLGTVQPMEISLEHSYERCKDVKDVDIAAVKAAMEADGYVFYETVFFSEDELATSYIIVSPEQDHIYAYTPGKTPAWARREYNRIENAANSGENRVGIHFVGFEDGSCVMCYGESFEEIKGYFVH